MTLTDLELSLIKHAKVFRRLSVLVRNLRYTVERPELLFCRNCGDFELHKWKANILDLPDYYICVECNTIYG